MSSPVTIVIPVYNREDTLRRTLQSIETQKVAPSEVILVDNGSTDGSLGIISAWADGKANVKIVSEKKRGACAARNAGLAEVRTEYVDFFDSDDVMLPHHVSDFTAAIAANPDADILGRNIVTRRLDGSSHTEYFTAHNPIFHHIFRSSLSTGRMVVRTSLVRSVGGWNESLTGWDDYELGVRLLLRSRNIMKVPGKPSVIAYQQRASLTGADFSSHPERWEDALDMVYRHCVDAGRADLLKWVDARSMILAAQYRLEADSTADSDYAFAAIRLSGRLRAQVLSRTEYPSRMKMIFLHNRYFRRLTWVVARTLFSV